MQKKGTDSSGQDCITILPRSCQNPSFARATPSPIFGNHLGGSVPMPCRPHCRHPPDGSVLADVPSHSVRSGFHHLSSPLGKDPPIDDGNLQEIMGIFLTNTGCWTQGRGPGTGKAQTTAFIDAPAPSLNLIRYAGSPTITPTQSLGSRRTASRSRIVSSHPPSRLTTAGLEEAAQSRQDSYRSGRPFSPRPGRRRRPVVVHEHQTVSVLGLAEDGEAPPWKTQLDRRSQFLLRLVSTAPATRPLLHSNPHPAITSDEAGLAKTRQANTARPAASFASSSNFTGPSFRSNCGVHRHSPIDLPLTGLLVQPGPSDGGCMQGME